MRVCFTSDLHGHPALYSQLDALLRTSRPDLLILGGDLFIDGEIDDPVGTQAGYVRTVFADRVRRWLADSPQMQIACILGNHDWCCTEAALQSLAEPRLCVLDHLTPRPYNGLLLLGYSCTPPTPYWVKDYERLDQPGDEIPLTGGAIWDLATRSVARAEAAEYFSRMPTIERDLSAASVPRSPWIFVSHAPPFRTHLDRLPHIDPPIGSKAVRAFIEQHAPLCSVHGHFHESPQVTGAHCDSIGSTLCINPGQTTSRLHAVLFDSSRPVQTLHHTVLP